MKSSKAYYRELPVPLSTEEYETKAKDLADLCKEINRAKDKAKEEAKFNKEAIEKLEGTWSSLATIVRDKAEERSVECVDRFRYDSREVESVRTDTGEIIGTRAMTPSEYQQEMDLHGTANSVRFPKTAEA
jgi:hypothetical protein